MKIALLGGGGFRAPLLARACDRSGLGFRELALFDTDPARLETIAEVARVFAPGLEVRTTGDAVAAIRGSRFVIGAIRAGGQEARAHDERRCLEAGALGQETVGAAGAALAMRNIPAMLDLAQVMEREAPDALLVNYANPAGLVAEAVLRETGVRAVGVCDTPMELADRIVRLLCLDPERAVFGWSGVNHCGFLTELREETRNPSPEFLHAGIPDPRDAPPEDQLPELFRDPERLARAHRTPLFDLEDMAGVIPSEYVFLHQHPDRAAARARRAGTTRGEAILDFERPFFEAPPGERVARYREALDARERSYFRIEGEGDATPREERDPEGPSGYDRIGLMVIRGVLERPGRVVVNTTNRTAFGGPAAPELEPADVAEVPAVVGSDDAGRAVIQPLPQPPLPAARGRLVRRVRAAERGFLEAALQRNPRRAQEALREHPAGGPKAAAIFPALRLAGCSLAFAALVCAQSAFAQPFPREPGGDPFGENPFAERFAPTDPREVEQLVRAALFGRPGPGRARALATLIERDQRDVIPAFIAVLRVLPDEDGQLLRALRRLARTNIGRDWKAWTEWQETHSEIRPFRGFDAFKADILAGIDPGFRDFVHRGVKHEIRIEEIVWGGVKRDGIPALTDPPHIPAAQADYLAPGELVFGVEIGGDARAWPLRILDWHEMLNDTVGGVPVSLAYCTLCGAGILFDTRVPGRRKPLVFGSSGLLYRSNKLMYDSETRSLWNQFTGRPVVGELTGSDIRLKVLPVVIASWDAWRNAHPYTRVLSLDTGHERDYRPGQPYGSYFASPDLMFPVVVRDRRLDPKDRIFVLRDGDRDMAWALSLFEDNPILHDRVGRVPVALLGDAATETVRAYESGGRIFAPTDDPRRIETGGESWTVSEDALIGPGGERLQRLPGHMAYWFAWQSYLGDRPARVE